MQMFQSRPFSTRRGRSKWVSVSLLGGALLAGVTAQAGVFNIPHFVPAGDFGLGLEPELTLTHGAGVAINAKYTQGINDMLNVQGILGTGSGPRRFRVGGNASFEFFPDSQGQPGVGLAAQVLYMRIPTTLDTSSNSDTTGVTELTAIPFIHKTFNAGGKEIDPFLAVPFGLVFDNGSYRSLFTVVIGSGFKATENLWYTMEFGIAVNHTETYFSGGITYYH